MRKRKLFRSPHSGRTLCKVRTLRRGPDEDRRGKPTSENIGDKETFGYEALCGACIADEQRAELEAEALEPPESKLGLAEKHRDALRSFVETVFTDPQMILQVNDLDNRVRSSERQNKNVMWGIVRVLVVAVIALAALLATIGA